MLRERICETAICAIVVFFAKIVVALRTSLYIELETPAFPSIHSIQKLQTGSILKEVILHTILNPKILILQHRVRILISDSYPSFTILITGTCQIFQLSSIPTPLNWVDAESFAHRGRQVAGDLLSHLTNPHSLSANKRLL